MAYNVATQSPRLLKVSGETTEMACGIADASSTTLTVTVPQFSKVIGAVGNSLDSATSPILASTSGNTFTMTTASSDTIAWIAWGVAKI